MNRFELILVMLIVCLGCHKTPTRIDQIELLKEDLSESEFKEAIFGKWKSVYEKQGKENVESLELNRNGEAKIIIKKNSIKIFPDVRY